MAMILFLSILLSFNSAHADPSPEMNNCIELAIRGSHEGDCALNPDGILCVGLQEALSNATNCAESFEAAAFGCKKYGTADHSQEEWLAIAEMHLTSLSACNDNTQSELHYIGADGAANLGYQNGEIVTNSLKGMSLYQIFSSSPFARKLNITQLVAIQIAMGNSKAILAGLKPKEKPKPEESKPELGPWKSWP